MQHVLGNSILNADSFNSAFNILAGLHSQVEKADKIVVEGEQVINLKRNLQKMNVEGSMGKQLNHQVVQINRLLSDLIHSKKHQFFKETSAYYSTAKRINKGGMRK